MTRTRTRKNGQIKKQPEQLRLQTHVKGVPLENVDVEVLLKCQKKALTRIRRTSAWYLKLAETLTNKTTPAPMLHLSNESDMNLIRS